MHFWSVITYHTHTCMRMFLFAGSWAAARTDSGDIVACLGTTRAGRAARARTRTRGAVRTE